MAKNDVFTQLVKDIVHTVALFPALAGPSAEAQTGFVPIPVEQLLAFPLLPSSPEAQGSSVAPKTVGAAIIDVVSRLGEKISIARAAAIAPPSTPPADAPRRSETGTDRGASVLNLASAFAHGGSAGFAPAKDAAKPGYVLTSGKVASLLTTRFASPKLPHLLASSSDDVQTNIRALTRSLARQAAGMQTKSIKAHADNNAEVQGEVSTALYDQPFMMLLPAAAPSPESSAHPVQDVLRSWATHNKLESSDADAVQDLTVTPDGKTFVYSNETASNASLFSVGVDGSDEVELSGKEEYVIDSAVSPDGAWLVYDVWKTNSKSHAVQLQTGCGASKKNLEQRCSAA